MGEAREKALRAREASRAMAALGAGERNEALRAMARELRAQTGAILEANARDMASAREAGTAEVLLDRLMLDPARVDAMAAGLEEVATQPDPLGRVLTGSRLSCGLSVEKVTVPLGVVAMVYEARPNVTSDAAGLCVKTGNAALLRPGSLASRSCLAVAKALGDALESRSLPRDAVLVLGALGLRVLLALQPVRRQGDRRLRRRGPPPDHGLRGSRRTRPARRVERLCGGPAHRRPLR